MAKEGADYIKGLRVRLGLDAKTFAKLFGVSPVAVQKWEKVGEGRRNPSGACKIIMQQLEDPKLRKWHLKRIKH